MPSSPLIPYLSSPLVLKLRECLTMDLNDHVPVVTGIPPYMEHMCQIQEVKNVRGGG